MLKNRILTALALTPLAVLAILYLPPDGFAVFWGSFMLVSAWEWAGLAGLPSNAHRIGYSLVVLAFMVIMRLTAADWAPIELPGWFYWPVVAWWFVCGMAFRKIPERLLQIEYPLGLKLGLGIFILLTAWASLTWLRVNFSQYQVLYVSALIWVADIGAYFVGKRWGNTKLCEAISPGKTVEGVYGALLAAVPFAVAVGFWSDLSSVTLTDFVALSLATVIVSVIGDLFESLVKRIRGVKDSSNILPGHGGVLDRVDSLIAATSVFYAGSMMLNIFIQPPDSNVVLESPIHIEQEVPSQSEEGEGPAERPVPMDQGGFESPGPEAAEPPAPESAPEQPPAPAPAKPAESTHP